MIPVVQVLEHADDETEDGAVVPTVLDDHGPADESRELRSRPGPQERANRMGGRLARDKGEAYLASRVTPS